MTTPVQVAQLALSEIGQRTSINSFSDTSPAAQWAALNYTPRIQSLLRAASWDFARAQIELTVYKQAAVNGVVSNNPPPQPWLYSYIRPPDCLRARFILPTVPVAPSGTPLTTSPTPLAWTCPTPVGIPFVVGTDFDPQGNPIGVILTNLNQAQLIYTRDLSQTPDLWDDLFLNAATAYLGCYAIMALARNEAQYAQQAQTTKGLLDQARVLNGDEGSPSIDHNPDWLRVRQSTGINWAWNQGAIGGYGGWAGGYDGLSMPGGLRF